MEKAFFAVWGDWEGGVHSYDLEAKFIGIEQVSEELGYYPNDIESVANLEIGESWKDGDGNHFIVRMPDKVPS